MTRRTVDDSNLGATTMGESVSNGAITIVGDEAAFDGFLALEVYGVCSLC